MKYDRNTLVNLLENEVITVHFTKKNGEERVMTCTLRQDLLPVKVVKEGETKERKVNPDVIPVYDVNAKAFRSFRADSVHGFVREND